MWLINLIPESIKWWFFWLLRPKYLVGTFVVAVKNGEVLIIKKKRGLSTGYQIPGGGKERGLRPNSNAVKELYEETGLCADSKDLYLVDCISHEAHRDVCIIYLLSEPYPPYQLGPRDTFEIEAALWVPTGKLHEYLGQEHLDMACRALCLDIRMKGITELQKRLETIEINR